MSWGRSPSERVPSDGRYPRARRADGADPPERRPLGGVGAVLAGFVGGYVVAAAFGGVAIGLGARENDAVTQVVTFIGLWSGFVGVPVLLSRLAGAGRMGTDFGLRIGGPRDVGLGLLGGMLAYGAVGFYSLVLSASGDHANLGHEAQQLSGHGLGVGFVAFGLCAAVGAPIAEEIFFRGLTQPIAQRYLGGVGGLVLTAIFFGLVHLGANPVEAVPPLAFFGAVAGVLAWRTQRLGPAIVAHMTFNGITVAALALTR